MKKFIRCLLSLVFLVTCASFDIQAQSSTQDSTFISNGLIFPVHVALVIDKMDSAANREVIDRADSNNTNRGTEIASGDSVFWDLSGRVPQTTMMLIVIMGKNDMERAVNQSKKTFGVKLALGKPGSLINRSDTVEFNIPHHFEFRKSIIYEDSYEAIIHYDLESVRKNIKKYPWDNFISITPEQIDDFIISMLEDIDPTIKHVGGG